MRIVFDDSVCEDVEVEPLPDGYVRLLETPLASETGARLGDVIELRSEGSVSRFVRVVAPSTLVTLDWLLPKRVADSDEIRETIQYVRTIGGETEQAFGGVLLVHVPSERVEDVTVRLQELLHSQSRGGDERDPAGEL